VKWLGALVLAALIVVGLLTLLGQGPSMPGLGLESSADEPASGYAAEHARLVQTGPDGTPQYLLEAEHLTLDSTSEDLAAQDLKLNYVPADAATNAHEWTLTAREGHMPGGSMQIALSGNVRLTGKPAGAREPVRFETSVLDFDIDKQVARTKLPVSFFWGSRRLTSRGLNADLKQGTLRLESSVHGRFPP
jgi:LPS export ABC transporter protein LptC